MRPAGARRTEGNLLAEVCLLKYLSPTLRKGGKGSGLRIPPTTKVFGSNVSGCCYLFKEAGLYPEEAEKFRPPDLRLPATPRDRNLRGASEAGAFPGPAGRRVPRGEAAGCAGLARDKGVPVSPARRAAAAQLLHLKHCLCFLGISFLDLQRAQGAPGVRVTITPASADGLAVH